MWGRLSWGGGHRQDGVARAVGHSGACTQTLRHSPGIFTPEMGLHPMNVGWVELERRGALGERRSFPGQEDKTHPPASITCHGSTTAQPLLGRRADTELDPGHPDSAGPIRPAWGARERGRT